MRVLSKSKLLAHRQCPKRLWLEIHRPELRVDTSSTQASFDVGNTVGEIARHLYDPAGKGVLIDAQRDGYVVALKQTRQFLGSNKPLFEAGFSAGGALAFADIMLPTKIGRSSGWRMVEIKSSTSIKDYHRDDVAIQAWVALKAGVLLKAIALAHIDNEWVYQGDNDYAGLLVEHDLSDEAFGRSGEVDQWIAEAQRCAGSKKEPGIHTGNQCESPYPCGFFDYCVTQEPQAKYPIIWLPNIRTKALKSHIAENNVIDLRDVPDRLLNERQLRVKACTLSGKPYFDKRGAAAALKPYGFPAYFLDFETIQFAVPIWKGTRPYQKIPFQFSLHRLSRAAKLEEKWFLDLTGKNPSKGFVSALLDACGSRGPIYVYNAGFEKSIMSDLGRRFPKVSGELNKLIERIVDLQPISEESYYHPAQEGSWSIKRMLPAIAPELSYDALDGVQDGGMAMDAYLEAISLETLPTRKDAIFKQLQKYCRLDTLAMVTVWRFFSGLP